MFPRMFPHLSLLSWLELSILRISSYRTQVIFVHTVTSANEGDTDMTIRSVWVASAILLLVLSGCVEVSSEPAPESAQETKSQAEENETPAVTPSEEADSEDAVVAKEGTFKMAVFNYDTQSYPDLEIWVRGTGSWYPNADSGDGRDEFGPFPVGESIEGDFFVYPFGRDGIEVPVTLELSQDHISESDRDMVWVWIEDEVLIVTGTPLLEDVEVALN